MRDLPANTLSQYLRQGKRPRTFVTVAAADRYWATAAHGNYIDRIASGGEVARAIHPFGGQEITSNCRLSILTLGEEFRLHTPHLLPPLEEGSHSGAGSLNYQGPTYQSVRGQTYAYHNDTSVDVGQRFLSGQYYTYRGYLQVLVPPYITSCEEGFISLDVAAASVWTGFDLYAVAGTWTAIAGGMYNDFDGWVYGLVPYEGEPLTERLPAASIEAGGRVMLRLNAAGRAAIVAATGGTLRLMLLSSRDCGANAPTTDEFVRFAVSRLTGTPSLTIHVNSKHLDNRSAQIYIGFVEDDHTLPPVVSSAYLTQVGAMTIDRIARADGRTLDLDLVSARIRRNGNVPAGIITADEFPKTPANAIGRPYPVAYGRSWGAAAYGRHRNGIGLENSGGVANPLSGLRDYFPCPVIDPGNAEYRSPRRNDPVSPEGYTTPLRAIAGMRELHDASVGFPALWDDRLNLFVRLWGEVSDQEAGADHVAVDVTPKRRIKGSNANGGLVNAVSYEDFLGAAVSIIPVTIFDSLGVEDPENCFAETGDEITFDDPNEYIVLGFPHIGSGGEINKVELVFEIDGDTTSNYLQATVHDRPVDIQSSGTNGVSSHDPQEQIQWFTSVGATFITDGVQAGDWLIITAGSNAGRYKITEVTAQTGLKLESIINNGIEQNFIILPAIGGALATSQSINGSGQRVIDLTAVMDWSIERKLIKLRYATANSPYSTFDVSKMQLRIFYAPEAIDAVWLDKAGVDDDSGAITGTVNAVIENPAHVIAAVAHHEGGLSLNDIDMDSIAAAAAKLSGWLFAFQLQERTPLMNYYGRDGLLSRIGAQCNAAVFEDWRGRLKVSVFDPGAPFPHSGTDTPAGLDIADYDGAPADGSVTRHPIDRGSFSMRQIGIDDVRTSFEVHYLLNYATGQYGGSVSIGDGDGVAGAVEHNINAAYLTGGRSADELASMCAASRRITQTTNVLTVEADFIRDEQTATRLLQRLIEWHTPRRWEVSFTTWHNALEWEEGDMINVRTPPVYDLFGAAIAERKKWRIVELITTYAPYRVAVRAIEADAEVQ